MKIGILGPAGFSGSHIAIELLNRGHDVVGLSRSPERLGEHPHYTSMKLAAETAPIEDLIAAFSSLDVLVNAYNPSPGPDVYKTFIETSRRLLLAVRAVASTRTKTGQAFYYVCIGGTGSLSLPPTTPNQPSYLTAADSRSFWLAYRRSVADSEAATSHMEERIGPGSPMANLMRSYRDARIAFHSGTATDAHRATVREAEDPIMEGANPVPDLPLAARVGFAMLEHVPEEVLRWTFVSPPGRFRPGPRTGNYKVFLDEVPLAPPGAGTHESADENEFEGRLLGVSVAGLAVAVADEIEKGALVGKHWSPVSEWERDEVVVGYPKLGC